IDPLCTLSGERKRTLSPKALGIDTVRFSLRCTKPVVPVDTVGRPFVVRSKWSAATARPGDKVSVLVSLDLRALASQKVASVAAQMNYDKSVVRYDSSRKQTTFDLVQVNGQTQGFIAMAAGSISGEVVTGGDEYGIVRLWFTVVGAVGNSVT